MDPWLLDMLACPRHRVTLRESADACRLMCASGCSFPVVDGVPVLLLSDVPQTLWVAEASLRLASHSSAEDPYFVDTVGVSEADRQVIKSQIASGSEDTIDPIVSFLVLATCGNAYRHLKGRIQEYPIPELRLPSSGGDVFLDLGCNWGRWCVAAARKGYRPVGLDPSLGAVLAARRLARALGVAASFVVGDARHLPFHASSIDTVFSYSVLQHMDEANVVEVLAEAGRVLRPGGTSLVQMPSRTGIRCLYQQARRGFREPTGFEVRYWTHSRLQEVFGSQIGPSVTTVDCYFGIGLQYSDMRFMSPGVKPVLWASEVLRRLSERIPALGSVADSWYVRSTKLPPGDNIQRC